MMNNHPDLDVLCRPIECSILDDAVDEYLDAEIDQMASMGENAGIDGMLDAEIEAMCESGETTFEDLVNLCESHKCCCSDDDDEDDDDEDDDEDDEEEYAPSNDDYTNYSEVEFKHKEDESDD